MVSVALIDALRHLIYSTCKTFLMWWHWFLNWYPFKWQYTSLLDACPLEYDVFSFVMFCLPSNTSKKLHVPLVSLSLSLALSGPRKVVGFHSCSKTLLVQQVSFKKGIGYYRIPLNQWPWFQGWTESFLWRHPFVLGATLVPQQKHLKQWTRLFMQPFFSSKFPCYDPFKQVPIYLYTAFDPQIRLCRLWTEDKSCTPRNANPSYHRFEWIS